MASLDYIREELGSHSYNAWMEDTLRDYMLRQIKGERPSLYEFIDFSMRTRFEERKKTLQEKHDVQQPAFGTNL